jgi:hypothetical protein
VNALQIATLPAEIRRRISSPEYFTVGEIGLEAWEWLTAAGWVSDGSSASRDDIMGVRIGASGMHPRLRFLPANRHDFFYALGRLFRLGAAFRLAADRDYRDRCIERVERALIGWRAWEGKRRARFRYAGLRALPPARWAWSRTPS